MCAKKLRPRVKLVNSQASSQIGRMFELNDWEVVRNGPMELMCFVGGCDVTPELYGHKSIPHCGQTDFTRDDREVRLFNWGFNVPKVGICRGAQLLNVCNGGLLVQDLDGHAIAGKHEAKCHVTGKDVHVTSTHHQMMLPPSKEQNPTAEVLLTAEESTMWDMWNPDTKEALQVRPRESADEFAFDIESVWFPDTRSLCFQPHPEYDMGGETEELFWFYLNYAFGL